MGAQLDCLLSIAIIWDVKGHLRGDYLPKKNSSVSPRESTETQGFYYKANPQDGTTTELPINID